MTGHSATSAHVHEVEPGTIRLISSRGCRTLTDAWPLLSRCDIAYIILMEVLRHHLAALLVAVFALGLIVPTVQSSQPHQMAGMSDMAMDHSAMPTQVAKGVTDLCKAHCQAVIAVLPQPIHTTRPNDAPALTTVGQAIGLSSVSVAPEGPPPKA